MTNWENLESKSTGELLATFQGKKTPSHLRDKAFIAITNRFRRDVLDKCEIVCSRFGHGPGVAEIIAENTFKAYGKKGTFVESKGKGKTIEDSFKIYLYTIARNELTNFHRMEERKRKGQHYDGSETIVTAIPTDLYIKDADAATKFRIDIIQGLPKCHRAIYLTYTAYEKIDCNLPRKLMENLRAYCGGIRQSTVRSYKKEAVDKIANAMRALEFLNKKS